MAASRVERLSRVASLAPMVTCDLIGTKITVPLVPSIGAVLLVSRRVISFSMMIVRGMHSTLMMILVTTLPSDMMPALRTILD